jgi:hypothetical protein
MKGILMKNLLLLLSALMLSACTTVSPAQLETMPAAQRESLFHFQDRNNQELCKVYTNPNIPIGEATKAQIGEILKQRGVKECFDKLNHLVTVEGSANK